jgi:hypothetical protein
MDAITNTDWDRYYNRHFYSWTYSNIYAFSYALVITHKHAYQDPLAHINSNHDSEFNPK